MTVKSVKDVKNEKKLNQYAILLDWKIINYITNVKNVKKTVKTNKWIDWKVSKYIPILWWGHK